MLLDNTWSTGHNIPENDRYSDISTDSALVSLNFTEENYGIKLIYHEIDSDHVFFKYYSITFGKLDGSCKIFYLKVCSSQYQIIEQQYY